MDTQSSDIYIPVHLRLNTPKQGVVVERYVMYPSRWWQKALPLPDDLVFQHNWFVIQNMNTATLQQTTCCVSATGMVCQVVTNYEATSMMLFQASPLTIKHTLHKAWRISQNCKTTCKQAHKHILAPTVKEQNTQLHCALAHRLTLKLYSRKPLPTMCHGSLTVVAWWGGLVQRWCGWFRESGVIRAAEQMNICGQGKTAYTTYALGQVFWSGPEWCLL